MGVLRDYWKERQRLQRERDEVLQKVYRSESLLGESFSDFRKRINKKGKSLT